MRDGVRLSLTAALVLGLCAHAASTRAADDAPPIHETLREFLPTSRYEFVPEAKGATPFSVLLSARAAAYLIRGAALDAPLLVRTGACVIESVPKEALVERQDGGVDLRADAAPKGLGHILVQGSDILIDVPGLKGKLAPPAPLLGWQSGAGLSVAVPEYARDARKYVIGEECVTSLKATKGSVRVFVYFGSWCPTCSTVMGRVLKLEQALMKDAAPSKEGEAAAFRFDYYGAKPEPDTWEEPELKTHEVEVLPAGIIYVDGKFRGRIVGFDWSRPEAALRRVLAGP